MTTENIDIVVKSAGTQRVVRDLTDIGDAADAAQKRIDNMQRTLDQLGSNSYLTKIRALQTALGMVGSNSALSVFATQLQQVNALLAQTQSLSGSVNSAVGRLGGGHQLGSLQSALRGVIAYLSVKQIMDWADAWTAALGKVNIFTDSMEETQVILSRLFDTAQEARQPLTGVVQLFHMMTIAGKELGVSYNQVLAVTNTVSKALAIQGTSGQQARGVLIQLSEAMSQGIVRGQQFNSLMRNLPLVLRIAAENIDGAGGSIARLRQMMLNGQLTSKMLFDGIMKGATSVNELLDKAPKTFGQSFANLVNSIEKFLGKINEAYGISNKFYELLSTIGKNLDTIFKTVALIGVVLAVAFAPAILATALGLLVSIGTAVLTIAGALLASPIGVLVALGAAAYLFQDNILLGVDNVTTMRDLIAVALPVIVNLFSQALTAIGALWTGYWDLVKTILTAVGGAIKVSVGGWLNSFSEFYADTGDGFAGVVRSLAKTADAIAGLILGLGIGIVRVLGGIPDAVDQIGAQMRNFMYAHIESMINATIDGINKLRELIGKEGFQHIQIARADVNKNYFENYGKSIMTSIDAGFDMQGNLLLKSVDDILAKAQTEAQKRIAALNTAPVNLDNPLGDGTPIDAKTKKTHAPDIAEIRAELDQYKNLANEFAEIERHKEVMLKQQYDQGLIDFRSYESQLSALQQTSFVTRMNLFESEQTKIQDLLAKLPAALASHGFDQRDIANIVKELTTRLKGLNDEMTKLGNKNQEHLGDTLTKALAPAKELLATSDKELANLQNATQQEILKLQTKSNSALVSERDLFVQEETLKLTNKYEDKLVQIQAVFDKLNSTGAFDNLADPATLKAFNDILSLIEKYKDAIAQIKQDAPGILGQAFDQTQINKFAKDLNSTLADAIISAGKDGGKGLRDFLTNELLRKPFKILLQGILQPLTGTIAQVVMGGVQSLASGVNTTGSLISTAGSAASLAGVGSSIATAYTAGSTSVGVMAGSVAGGGGVAGGVASALGAIPVYGWIALAAIAAYEVFSKHGGPKVDGSAGTLINTVGNSGHELDSVAVTALNGLNAQYSSLLTTLGGSAAGVSFGLGLSTDPKGTSPSFVEADVSKNGTGLLNDMNLNVGRSQDELQAAIALQVSQALLAGLQAADLPVKIADYFKSLGDPLKMSADQINAAITLATNARAVYAAFVQLGPVFGHFADLSVQSVDLLAQAAGGFDALNASLNSYYQNFYTDEEKKRNIAQSISDTLSKVGVTISVQQVLNTTRAQFRALVEQFAAMGDAGVPVVNALLSVSAAFASITDSATIAAASVDPLTALNTAMDNLDKARQAEITTINTTISNLTTSRDKWKQFAQGLTDFMQSLQLGELSPLTPAQKYATAQQQFQDTFNKAMSGDETAMGQLQNAASAYLQASQTYNASSAQYQQDFAQVQAALAMAAAKSTSMVTTAEADLAIQQAQLSSLQTVNESVLTIPQALTELQSALLVALQANAVIPQSVLAALAQQGITVSGTGAGSTVSAGGAITNVVGTSGSWTDDAIRSAATQLIQNGQPFDVYNWLRLQNISAATFDSVMGWPDGTTNTWAQSVGLPTFGDGGYASGRALVGEYGPEIVDFATPGRVYTASQTRDFMSATGGVDSTVSALLSRLITEVETLREESLDAARMHIDATRESASETANAVGDSVSRVVRRSHIDDRQRKMAKVPV